MTDFEMIDKMYMHWLSVYEDPSTAPQCNTTAPQRAIEYGYLKAINMCLFVLEKIDIYEYKRRLGVLNELAVCYNIIKE